MSDSTVEAQQDSPRAHDLLLLPTEIKQCWGFMIGSSLFAIGAAISISGATSDATANACYFVGAWFFTGAGLVQLALSGPMTVPVSYGRGVMVRAAWLAAATQSFGTLMFNISTTAALESKTLASQKHFVWSPDAGGSVAFLISGVLAVLAWSRVNPGRRAGGVPWWAVQINMLGCVAFGLSAVGAYITGAGTSVDDVLANWGTLIGALCFFAASLISLPGARR